MYITKESLNRDKLAFLDMKCGTLKKDLECEHGAFLAGTKVGIVRSASDEITGTFAFIVYSVDDKDLFYLDRKQLDKKWADELLTEDQCVTTEWNDISNRYEQEKCLHYKKHKIKQVVIIVLAVILMLYFIINAIIGLTTHNLMCLSTALVSALGVFFCAIWDAMSMASYERNCKNELLNKTIECQELLK